MEPVFKLQDINAGYIDYSDDDEGDDAAPATDGGEGGDDGGDMLWRPDMEVSDHEEDASSAARRPAAHSGPVASDRPSRESLAGIRSLADMIEGFQLEEKRKRKQAKQDTEARRLDELRELRKHAWSGQAEAREHTGSKQASEQSTSVDDNAITEQDLLPEALARYRNEEKTRAANAEYYDDIYFDSDSEEAPAESAADAGDGAAPKKRPPTSRRQKLSNDDLLYDDGLDEEDARWMDKQRRMYREGLKKSAPAPSGTDVDASQSLRSIKSDAILSCPFCFTTLCIDCQQHETYPDQFRAMFVLNCTVAKAERLVHPRAGAESGGARRSGKVGRASRAAKEAESMGVLHPVKCSECHTEVGVLGDDDLYHFFHVLASES